MKKIFRFPIYGTSCRSISGLRSLRPFDEIPGPQPLPLIGNIWRYLPLIGEYKLDELYENAQFNKNHYGPLVREQITRNHTILHLFDPQDIEDFFRTDGREPHRRSHRALLKYRHDNPRHYNDGGLFPENGPAWSRIRKLFQKYLMQKSEISKRAHILDEISLHCINKLSGQQVIENFENFLYEWSVKSSLAVFLDYNAEDLPDTVKIRAMIKCLHEELEAIDGTEIKSDKWVKHPARCPFYQKLSRAERHLQSFVASRLDELVKHNSMRSHNSFIRDWLVNDKLDRKDVVGFILDSVLAALHTTVYTTTFLLNYIAKWDLKKVEQLRREVNDNMPSFDQILESDISDRMPTLKDCLKETLRIRPVSIGTGRLTQSEMVIRDYHIPKGIMVIAHNQTICMDSNIYEQPERFHPERWSVHRKMSREERPSAFAWLPYGFGPRACIGQRLANLQIQIFTARLIQHLSWDFLGPIKTRTTLVHTLEGGVTIKLERCGTPSAPSKV